MKKLHLSVMISMFLLSDVAYPVFIIENSKNKEVREDQISNDNSQYPDSCLIRCYKDKESIGTGTFLSQNVVLTIRHVVWLNQEDQAISPERVKVALEGKSYSVKEILIYPNNMYENLGSPLNEKKDTFALLVLDKAVDLPFNSFKSVKATNPYSPPNGLTVMGYGQGGLIKKDDCYNKDIEKIIFPSEHFRYQDNVDGLSTAYFPIGTLESCIVKMNTGDSGSSLLDEDKNIIGITMSGSASFGKFVSKLRELIGVKQDFFLSELDDKESKIYKRIMESSNPLVATETYVELAKESVVDFNNKIVEYSEEQIFAAKFNSDFLLFDEKSVEWVNNVVKDNSVTDSSCDIIFEEDTNGKKEIPA